MKFGLNLKGSNNFCRFMVKVLNGCFSVAGTLKKTLILPLIRISNLAIINTEFQNRFGLTENGKAGGKFRKIFRACDKN